MKQVILTIPDSNYPFFIELAKSLQFVKKIEAVGEPVEEQVIQNVKAGLQEVKLFKKGKLKTTPAKDFFK